MNAIAFAKWIERFNWTEAKTYSQTAPHEYIVKSRLRPFDSIMFEHAVRFIHTRGIPRKFWRKTYIYYDHAGYTYWTMGNPVSQTVILNRARAP